MATRPWVWGTLARLGLAGTCATHLVLCIGIWGRRGHVRPLLLLLFGRLGSEVGLRGSCRGVCVLIWPDLIIAWFCGLVCGGGGGGSISLSRALEIRYPYPERCRRVLTTYNTDRITTSLCMRPCSLAFAARSWVRVGCGAGVGGCVARVVSDSE